MYKVTKNIKILSFSLMILGLVGLAYGFYTAPHSIEESKAIVASYSHGEHDADHAVDLEHKDESHSSDHAIVSDHSEEVNDLDFKSDEHSVSHDEHVYHQLSNRPWSALYVAALFFFLISLGTLAFYAIQRASQAGWSPILFRVMEGITGYLLPGSIIILIFLILSTMHLNHLFIWMDPEVVNHDEIIKAKSGYLDSQFFIGRAIFYILGWNLYRFFSRKFSIAQDQSNDVSNHKKNFKISAGFLAFFIVTESMMSWDWIMSVDPHWFSTLFGWYVFASMFVSGITMIAIITIFLKSQGYLTGANHNHLHDLAKYMFGVSIFWAYLWFSQFMLIWYANIPEEVTYFITRMEDYALPFWGMLVTNLIFPFLVLMNSDYKRINWFIVTAGVVILIGHYIDFYNMIMPSTVGDQWYIGIPEIGGIMFFGGLFIYVVFNTLSKVPLEPSGDPLFKESEKFVY
ncbi:MAG: quinol:cytochrome C oxidoreductase [Flavobacteriaceae bacterium]|nr:quinol:cytochrome C oxidoreductase [Flavobacteriaceae bacterium]